MTSLHKEGRPTHDGAASQEHNHSQFTPTAPAGALTDEDALTERDRRVWFDGFTYGRAEGIIRGRELADAEAAARHAEAARVVLANLGVERDREADKRRAERSAAYWAARRGEGGVA